MRVLLFAFVSDRVFVLAFVIVAIVVRVCLCLFAVARALDGCLLFVCFLYLFVYSCCVLLWLVECMLFVCV